MSMSAKIGDLRRLGKFQSGRLYLIVEEAEWPNWAVIKMDSLDTIFFQSHFPVWIHEDELLSRPDSENDSEEESNG